jgi:hypothetical protein
MLESTSWQLKLCIYKFLERSHNCNIHIANVVARYAVVTYFAKRLGMNSVFAYFDCDLRRPLFSSLLKYFAGGSAFAYF